MIALVFGPSIVEGNLGTPDPETAGLFDPWEPVPGTELAPSVEALQINVADDRLVLRGEVAFDDAVDTVFAYVRVRARRFENPALDWTPVEGATVYVMDQDAPPPPEDDFTQPDFVPSEVLRDDTENYVIHRAWVPPARDEVVATLLSDDSGLARLQFPRATAGGTGGSLSDHDHPSPVASRIPSTCRRRRPTPNGCLISISSSLLRMAAASTRAAFLAWDCKPISLIGTSEQRTALSISCSEKVSSRQRHRPSGPSGEAGRGLGAAGTRSCVLSVLRRDICGADTSVEHDVRQAQANLW